MAGIAGWYGAVPGTAQAPRWQGEIPRTVPGRTRAGRRTVGTVRNRMIQKRWRGSGATRCCPGATSDPARGGAGGRTATPDARDRGDVPGWVMVTLMTAGLVLTLWNLAGDRLAAVFDQAMTRVLGG